HEEHHLVQGPDHGARRGASPPRPVPRNHGPVRDPAGRRHPPEGGARRPRGGQGLRHHQAATGGGHPGTPRPDARATAGRAPFTPPPVKTAVDSSVLFDVLLGDPAFGAASREALREAYDQGALVACEVVWAEVRALFADDQAFAEALGTLGVVSDAILPAAATLAGQLWRDSRKAAPRGRGRERVVADFLIGTHAQLQAERLLTRDEGFYRTHFRGIKVLAP